MTATGLQGDAQAISRRALAALSAAFHAQDTDALLAQFTAAPPATYAGSEAGEVATGHGELKLLFAKLFARPERYRFAFDDVRAHGSDDGVWLLADGHGYETTPDGEETRFPYRIAAVLIFEVDGWRWALLSGAEPTG
jgi:ketosteroid isomerase-like protein